MNELNTTWKDHRSSIYDVMVKHEYVLDDTLCCNCGQQPGRIRCHNCGDNWLLCSKCDQKYHQCKPFHDRLAWLKKHFSAIQSSQALDENGELIDYGEYFKSSVFATYTSCQIS